MVSLEQFVELRVRLVAYESQQAEGENRDATRSQELGQRSDRRVETVIYHGKFSGGSSGSKSGED